MAEPTVMTAPSITLLGSVKSSCVVLASSNAVEPETASEENVFYTTHNDTGARWMHCPLLRKEWQRNLVNSFACRKPWWIVHPSVTACSVTWPTLESSVHMWIRVLQWVCTYVAGANASFRITERIGNRLDRCWRGAFTIMFQRTV
jgi:hypothetical protein